LAPKEARVVVLARRRVDADPILHFHSRPSNKLAWRIDER
jgi:hypothetical protein